MNDHDDKFVDRFSESPVRNKSKGDHSEPVFEVVEAVTGLFTLDKRSPTLEGSVPLKAAQFCKPFIDGNAAGFCLWFSDSALIRKSKKGAVLGLTDEGYARITDDYENKIENLAARGLLVKGGYWHKQLKNGFQWQKNNRLYVWTGLLIRPTCGVWILISDAYNRRSPISVDEYVIPDDGSFVPLVLCWNLATAVEKDVWLEKEVACLTPLRPDVRFVVQKLADAPEVGRAYCDYFDAKWEGSAPGKYLGAYRKLTARENSVDAGDQATCRFVVAGGPNIHQIRTFNRYATAEGWQRNSPARPRLEYVVVRSIFEVSGRWDGHAVRDLAAETPRAVQRLRDQWAALYGPGGLESLDRLLVTYARSTHGPRIGEPYLAMAPWVFAVSPPGWSSLVDGYHLGYVDGMRAVLSTDRYYTILEIWQFIKPCRFKFGRGAPLLRILPVPRRLLQGSLRRLSLDSV